MVHKADTVTFFSNVQNAGRFGSMLGSVINFYGQRWRNESGALIPDENYYNDTLHPDAGTFHFFSGGSAQSVFGGYNVTTKTGTSFPRLTLANPDGLYLEDLSDMKVRYVLQLDSGHVFLNGWNLVVGHRSPGRIGGFSHRRFIVTGIRPGAGSLYRESLSSTQLQVAFPIGTAPDSYSPLTIQMNETTPADFHASVFDSVYRSAISGPSIAKNNVLKTWNIGSDRPEASVNIRLQHELADEDTFFSYHRDSSYVSRFLPANGYDTISPGGITNPGTITREFPQQQSFINSRNFPGGLGNNAYLTVSASPFQRVSPSTSDLLFYAHRMDIQRVMTFWYTRREVNVLHFELERRRETEDTFYTIKTVLPNISGGNSSFSQYYEYVDEDNYYDNWTYYRVKTITTDGLVIYSGIRRVPWLYKITVYPNPNTGLFRVQTFGLPKLTRMEVYDMSGKRVKVELLSEDNTLFNWKISAGTYIFTFYDHDTGKIINSQKVVILR